MIRNTAGQAAGCQMTATADGSDFAGTVTVYITKDNGVQAIGSVGAGLCTNEGHGYYTYNPSQAETDAAEVAFTFVGTGAITKTRTYEPLTPAQAAAAGGVTPTGNLVSDLLDTMAILNNELELEVAGADEGRAIIALTLAQHQFETQAALYPRALQSTITVTTAANVETSAWSTSLLRLDAIWLLDANGVPINKLEKIQQIGGHVPTLPWPLDLALATGTGNPSGYYASSQNFYWLPLPSGVASLRVYGLIEQAEFGTRNDAFNYTKRCKLAIASFAVRLLAGGIGDDATDFDTLAARTFGPLIRSLKKLDRSSPLVRRYDRVHLT